MKPAHKCYRVFKNSKVFKNPKVFLANYFKNRMYQNSDIKIRKLKHYAKQDLRVHVIMSKCKRARKLLIKEMDGSFKVECAALLAYVVEIERSNPDFMCKVELN